MHYLFMGIFCDKRRETEYLSKTRRGAQGAVNTFQWNLLDGFVENQADMTILNTMPVGAYPRNYSQLCLKSKKWEYESLPCTEIGFINLPIFKQCLRAFHFYRAAKQWIERTVGEKTIVVYSLYVPFLWVVKCIKHYYPQVNICVIVTDLPGKFGVKRGWLKTWFDNLSLSLVKNIDSFVLLTEHMKAPLQVGKRPYIVVEGICNERTDKQSVYQKKKAVLYTGSLNPVYGILDLVTAFESIEDPACELWICGKGGAEAEIRQRVAYDPRIKFKGYLKKQEIFKLQKQATVLVNPRKNEGAYTKYSFPSKTMEYMISGTPVLMYALEGMPQDYKKYGYFIGDEKMRTLSEGLAYVLNCSEDERKMMGDAAREYVVHTKSSRVQAKRILDLLETP